MLRFRSNKPRPGAEPFFASKDPVVQQDAQDSGPFHCNSGFREDVDDVDRAIGRVLNGLGPKESAATWLHNDPICPESYDVFKALESSVSVKPLQQSMVHGGSQCSPYE